MAPLSRGDAERKRSLQKRQLNRARPTDVQSVVSFASSRSFSVWLEASCFVRTIRDRSFLPVLLPVLFRCWKTSPTLIFVFFFLLLFGRIFALLFLQASLSPSLSHCSGTSGRSTATSLPRRHSLNFPRPPLFTSTCLVRLPQPRLWPLVFCLFPISILQQLVELTLDARLKTVLTYNNLERRLPVAAFCAHGVPLRDARGFHFSTKEPPLRLQAQRQRAFPRPWPCAWTFPRARPQPRPLTLVSDTFAIATCARPLPASCVNEPPGQQLRAVASEGQQQLCCFIARRQRGQSWL